MDNTLPGNPSNPNNGNNNSVPPPFGSNFNPHTNPPDPNNSKILSGVEGPYAPPQQPIPQPSQPSVSTPTTPNLPNTPNNPPEDSSHSTYSEVASHKLRDSHGRFASDHVSDEDNSKLDEPKENFLKRALKYIVKIKWRGVSGYIIGFVGVVTIVYNLPATRNFIEKNFPNSSPVFGREVSIQGVLKSSNTGLYTLVLPSQEAYTLELKPTTALTNLKKLNEVLVKGRLGWTPFVIKDVEIYPLSVTTQDDTDNPSKPLKNSTTLKSSDTPDPSNPSSPSDPSLPPLFSNLTWEVTKTKTLIFTSGLRKIEQEGVYLESAQVPNFPQDFINYYTNQLTNLGFKQTLSSTEPSGTTITFAKEDLFLTFGVKNIYTGVGENRKITGYKAFIEHN